MKQIAVVLASTQKNRELAEVLIAELEEQGAYVDLINLVEADLPMYTSVYEQDWDIPEKIHEIYARLKAADGLLFVSPEYNGGVPPVLSNMISWVSRLGDDWRLAFNGKVGALATHSGSSGLTMLMALRTQLAYLGVNMLGRQLVTTYTKPLNPESKKAVIETLIKCSGEK